MFISYEVIVSALVLSYKTKPEDNSNVDTLPVLHNCDPGTVLKICKKKWNWMNAFTKVLLKTSYDLQTVLKQTQNPLFTLFKPRWDILRK